MLKHRELTLARINQLGKRLQHLIYSNHKPLLTTYLPSPEPLPFKAVRGKTFNPIEPGTVWGDGFDCAWFRLEGKLDSTFKGKQVVALIDLGGEACVFDRYGKPVQGLTPKFDDRHGGIIGPKREVRLKSQARGNEQITLLLDAGANHLQGRQRRCRFGQADLCVLDPLIHALYHEFRFLELLMLELPDTSRHAQLLLRCLNDVCNILTDFTPEEVKAARARLSDELARPSKDSALSVSAIGHAHLDVAWLWPLRETVRKCARTFSTALRMMEEYPDYHFGASQPHLYQMTKDNFPALYEDIKAAVLSGRWEVQGGMWVESDCNIPSGESLVRQILYGKRFFLKEFGIDVRHLWLPDVFGYSAALPQILKKSGIDYFTTHKLNWNQFNEFPHHTMYWQGIDGSRVFAHFMAGNDYNVPATPASFMNFERKNRDGDRTEYALALFGIGDGGGGPGRTHIEWSRLAKNLEDLPRVTMEPAAEFFPKAEATATDLMTWVGELYFEYHRGTYTSQALVKKRNREIELLLRENEFLWAQLDPDLYPRQEFERIWKVLLLNQFHDIIPGSSINRVYHEAHEQYDEASHALHKLRQTADQHYSEAIETTGMRDPHIVMNPLSWERETVVFLRGERRILWVDAMDKALESQRVEDGVLVKLNVPSMGHNTIHVGMGQPAKQSRISPVSDRELENDNLKVEFAKSGQIDRIYDKVMDREVVPDGQQANVFKLYEDLPLAYEAWDIDAYYLEKPPSLPRLIESNLHEEGPLIATIKQVWEDTNYRITQKISLRQGDRILEFDTHVDWRESQRMLRVDFPVNVMSTEARFEIQFGSVSRPTHNNTSWDMARFETVAHKWADLSQPNYGVALLNDCKYGHRIFGNTISLNLLRSPTRPDPEADRHEHHFRYALYPHPGDHVSAQVVNRAYEFNVLARVYKAKRKTGSRPSFDSMVRSNRDNVIVDTIKRAEDSDDLIIRCYEAYGIDCEVALTINLDVANASEVNLLEKEIQPVKVTHGAIVFPIGPYEIRTFRIKPG
ncbi:MAG: alpha-mannosidase [Pseudomonadales bacterium]